MNFQAVNIGVVIAIASSIVLQFSICGDQIAYVISAQFPGPISHAASHLPYLWSRWRGTIHYDTKNLHYKYGEVVRVRPDHLTFTHPQAWKDIYDSEDPAFCSINGSESYRIIYANDTDHSYMCKLLAHAYSNAILREQEDILAMYFGQLKSSLKKAISAGQPVDLNQWYNHLTVDITADLCLGESFHILETGECHSLVDNMVASSETIATLLCGVTYYLLANPERHRRVRDEVREAFNSSEEIGFTSTAKLPCLGAILDEGLHIFPPVPISLPKRIADKGAMVTDIWIPGNTIVMVPQWAINDFADNRHNPNAFVPKCWLAESTPRHENHRHTAQTPFSTEPRNCIGRNLVHNKMRSTIAHMLWHFDMQLFPVSKAWPDQRVLYLPDKIPLNVELILRDNSS